MLRSRDIAWLCQPNGQPAAGYLHCVPVRVIFAPVWPILNLESSNALAEFLLCCIFETCKQLFQFQVAG